MGAKPTQGMDVCMCVYFLFGLSCVYVAALRWTGHSCKGSYRLYRKDYGTEDDAEAQQMAVELLMDE
jgi:hypothetical protein